MVGKEAQHMNTFGQWILDHIVALAIGWFITFVCFCLNVYCQEQDDHTTAFNLSAPAKFGEYEETADYAAAWKAGGFWGLVRLKLREYWWELFVLPIPYLGVVLLISAYTTFRAVKNNRYQMQTILHAEQMTAEQANALKAAVASSVAQGKAAS